MGLGIPPLEIKIMLVEPSKIHTMLVGGLGVLPLSLLRVGDLLAHRRLQLTAPRPLTIRTIKERFLLLRCGFLYIYIYVYTHMHIHIYIYIHYICI